MDKETLSNYGWIVIAVLVLAVMIALATPFGDYISGAVKSTTAGLFETNRSALNSTGLIDIDGQQFDGDPIVRSGKIVKAAKYTKADGTTLEGDGTNTLPDAPVVGDVYEEGDYKYTYNKGLFNGVDYGSEWSVVVKDNTKTEYGEILSEIAGKPVTHMTKTFFRCTSLTISPTIPNSVTNMSWTFCHCTSLKTAPTIPNSVTGEMFSTFSDCTSLKATPVISNSVTKLTVTFSGCTSLTTVSVIPNSVTNMTNTFEDCTSLTTAPEIPNSVTCMEGTFEDCTSLKTAPSIPNGVTRMSNTFYGCTSLTTAPTIPSNVTDMFQTFWNCTSLVGTIEINANPTRYDVCLKNTQITEITGSTTLKTEILATKNQQQPDNPWF